MKRKFDAEEIKKDFRVFDSPDSNGNYLVYLDNSATTQKPACVVDSLVNFYTSMNANVHRSFYEMGTKATKAYENARVIIKNFINAKSQNEIVFTRGATESLNCLAEILGQRFINSGDEIIVSELEHHSNLIPWLMCAKKRNAKVIPLPVDSCGNVDLKTLDSLINKKTRIIAISHVSNVLGTIPPIKEIVEIAHANGSMVVIDAAQALAHIPVDVRNLNCDFLVGSGHKMYGPMGVGFFYGKAALLDQLPPYHGGGTMMDDVSMSGFTVADVPKRFEAGTPPVADVIAYSKAIEYLSQFDWAEMVEYEDNVVHYAENMLRDIPEITLIGCPDKKVAVVSFLVKDIHPHDISTIVNAQNVAIRAGHHCCQPLMKKFSCRGGVVRASFGIYNTLSDVDKLIITLKKAIKVFKN